MPAPLRGSGAGGQQWGPAAAGGGEEKEGAEEVGQREDEFSEEEGGRPRRAASAAPGRQGGAGRQGWGSGVRFISVRGGVATKGGEAQEGWGQEEEHGWGEEDEHVSQRGAAPQAPLSLSLETNRIIAMDHTRGCAVLVVRRGLSGEESFLREVMWGSSSPTNAGPVA